MRLALINNDRLKRSDTELFTGTGSPEGVVTADVGDLYSQKDVGKFWVKESGSGNTGWTDLNPSGTFPGSSTDNAIPRFDGVGGSTLQNSGVTIDDSDNVAGVGELTTTGAVSLRNGSFRVLDETTIAAALAVDTNGVFKVANAGDQLLISRPSTTGGVGIVFTNNSGDRAFIGNAGGGANSAFVVRQNDASGSEYFNVNLATGVLSVDASSANIAEFTRTASGSAAGLKIANDDAHWWTGQSSAESYQIRYNGDSAGDLFFDITSAGALSFGESSGQEIHTFHAASLDINWNPVDANSHALQVDVNASTLGNIIRAQNSNSTGGLFHYYQVENGGGDISWHLRTNATNSISFGLDNSDGDSYKVTRTSTPSAAASDTLLRLGQDGEVHLSFDGNALTHTWFGAQVNIENNGEVLELFNNGTTFAGISTPQADMVLNGAGDVFINIDDNSSSTNAFFQVGKDAQNASGTELFRVYESARVAINNPALNGTLAIDQVGTTVDDGLYMYNGSGASWRQFINASNEVRFARGTSEVGGIDADGAWDIGVSGDGEIQRIYDAYAIAFGTFTTTGTLSVLNVTPGVRKASGGSAKTLLALNNTGVVSGQHFVLMNSGGDLTIKNEEATATAGMRIITGTGADVTITGDGAATFQYDSDSNRWRLLGVQGGSAGATPSEDREFFTGNASTTQFTMAAGLLATDILDVFVNGVIQREGGSFDYTVDLANDRVDFNSAPSSGATIMLRRIR